MKTLARCIPLVLGIAFGWGCLGLTALFFQIAFPVKAQDETPQLIGKNFSAERPGAQVAAKSDQPGSTTGPAQITTELAVDDGSNEAAIGVGGGGTLWGVNRLTPTSYPSTITGVLLYFQSATQQGLPLASPITVLVGTNPSGGANINNIVFSQQINAAVQRSADFHFYQVTPVTINSGDFVVGLRVTHEAGVSPLAIDRTPPMRRRSYVSQNGTTFTILDDAVPAVAGNLMIRALVQGQPPGCPTVSSVNPPGGVVGAQVTITGNNFTGVTSVRFAGGVAAQFTINSNTQITATVPQGAVTGPITISKPNCPDAQTAPFAVNIGSPTELAVDDGTFETTFGLSGGGTSWRVNRLTPTSYPATMNAVSIFFRSNSNLTVGAPLTIVYGANPGGGTFINGIQLQTMDSSVQALSQFNVYNVSPLTINSGDFIVGYKITHAASVFPYALDTTPPSQRRSYRSLDGVTFNIIDDIPQTTAGNYGIRARLQTQTQNCPTVSGVNPASGAIGSQVTINGSNFTGVNAVRFANNVNASFTVNSDTQITVTVPNGAVTGPITISKPNCPDATTAAFTVNRVCMFAIAPTSQFFLSGGGNGSVNVMADTGCAWTAASNAAWITITGGASGSGNGMVDFSVAADASGAPRSGTMTIAGQTFTVQQGFSAGSGWSRQTSGVMSELRSVHFINDSEGWAAGANATLLRTTNGGSSWSPVNTGVDPAKGFNFVRFLSQNVGWAGGASAVARTMNGGANWATASLPTSFLSTDNISHNTFFPVSSTEIWAAGGGMSGNSSRGPAALYILSTGGTLTRDFSSSFGGSAPDQQILDIHFLAANNGWLIGPAGIIRFAPVGSTQITIQFQSRPTSESLNGIYMLDGNTGWIVGNNGVILKTVNGGGVWTLQTSGVTANLRDVNFVDANRGWAVGDGGVILTTSDGGATWTPEPSGVTDDLRGVFFPSVAVGYAVGANGVILKRMSAPGAVASVSAASFADTGAAAESIIASFGQGFAGGVEVATSVPLPTTLGGTSVVVRDSASPILAGAAAVDRLAPLFFVSPNQINLQIPPGVAPGAATVNVLRGGAVVASGTVQINSVAPGLFTANASGQGVAAAVVFRRRADGSESFEPVAQFDQAQNRFIPIPIDLGPDTDQVFLIPFGTGFRFGSTTTATIGGVNSEVLFAGASPGFVGLDQANIRLSRNLIGRGEVDVALTVDGKAANTVRIVIR
jgi:uncharacterized protein (TIGR03437 family)